MHLRVGIEKDGKENLILNPFAFPGKRSSNIRSFVLPVIPIVRNSCALPLCRHIVARFIIIISREKKIILENAICSEEYIAYGNELQSAWKIIRVQIDCRGH